MEIFGQRGRAGAVIKWESGYVLDTMFINFNKYQ